MTIQIRKQIRLKDYDYSRNGCYFITICTKDKQKIFGKITVGNGFPVAHLSDFGEIIEKYLHEIPEKYVNAKIDKYIIMPDHIHLIIILQNDNGEFAKGTGNPFPTVGNIMGWFKYITSKTITAEIYNGVVHKIWQKSYYDRIIRTENEYLKTCEYIENNPLKWKEDKYYE